MQSSTPAIQRACSKLREHSCTCIAWASVLKTETGGTALLQSTHRRLLSEEHSLHCYRACIRECCLKSTPSQCYRACIRERCGKSTPSPCYRARFDCDQWPAGRQSKKKKHVHAYTLLTSQQRFSPQRPQHLRLQLLLATRTSTIRLLETLFGVHAQVSYIYFHIL